MIKTTKAHFKLPARASFWYIASSALAKGIGVIGTPIFTRLLSPEAYGLYPLYTTWLSIFSVFATLELTGSVITKGVQRSEGREKQFVFSALCLILFIYGIFCSLYLIFREYINTLTGLSTAISLCMLGQILATAVIGLYSAVSKYFYDYKITAAIGIIFALSSPIISIAIIQYTDFDAEARILGSLAASSILALPLFINIIKSRSGARMSISDFLSDIKFLLKFNIPLLPHYLSMATIVRVGEIAVGKFFGTEALGKYSVAMSVGLSLNMVTGGLTGALSPWIMRRLKAGQTERVRALLSMCAEGLALVCLCVLSFAPETVRLITPKEYHDCLLAVYPLAISVLPAFISSALLSAEMYYERTFSSSVPTIISALICSALSLFILPKTDYRVASLFVLISYVIMMYMNKEVLKRLSGTSLISDKRISQIIVLSIIYSAVLAFFKDNLLLRLLVFAPLLPLIVKKGIAVYRNIKE